MSQNITCDSCQTPILAERSNEGYQVNFHELRIVQSNQGRNITPSPIVDFSIHLCNKCNLDFRNLVVFKKVKQAFAFAAFEVKA